jgi:membrane protein YdbS with pleckstrin-like domain
MEEKIYKMATARLVMIIIIGLLLIPIFGLGLLIIVIALFEYMRLSLTITPRGIVIRSGVIRVHTEEIPFNKINTISVERGLLGNIFGYGNILFLTGNDVATRFLGISNPEALRNEIMSLVGGGVNPIQQVVSSTKSSYDELNDLAQLKEKGIITEQEFEAKKKQILGI